MLRRGKVKAAIYVWMSSLIEPAWNCISQTKVFMHATSLSLVLRRHSMPLLFLWTLEWIVPVVWLLKCFDKSYKQLSGQIGVGMTPIHINLILIIFYHVWVHQHLLCTTYQHCPTSECMSCWVPRLPESYAYPVIQNASREKEPVLPLRFILSFSFSDPSFVGIPSQVGGNFHGLGRTFLPFQIWIAKIEWYEAAPDRFYGPAFAGHMIL